MSEQHIEPTTLYEHLTHQSPPLVYHAVQTWIDGVDTTSNSSFHIRKLTEMRNQLNEKLDTTNYTTVTPSRAFRDACEATFGTQSTLYCYADQSCVVNVLSMGTTWLLATIRDGLLVYRPITEKVAYTITGLFVPED